VVHERGLAGQLVAGHQVAAVDLCPELVGDLSVGHTVVGAVKPPQLHDSSRRLDLYDRCRTLPNVDGR